MEKLNKTKVIAIIIIVLVVIAAIILGVIFANSKKNPGNEFGSKAGSISSTLSEFEALKVKDIELTYSEERNETILEFSIDFTANSCSAVSLTLSPPPERSL